MMYDAKIATYILNSVSNAYSIEDISRHFLELDIADYENKEETSNIQTSLFDKLAEKDSIDTADFIYAIYAYVIGKTRNKILQELEKIDSIQLFNNIEMPIVEVLADMQYEGMYIDEKELIQYGDCLKKHIEELKVEIYEMAGEEFNINSPKQLGTILFEKLELKPCKKTKSGYSTDVDALDKVKNEHPIVEKILEYRQIMKLNSTYVEGLIPFINPKTKRIHTFFHQTVTATGRLSST